MSRYEWPPRPVLDPREAADLMAAAMQAAWGDLEDERLRVLASRTMGRKRLVNAWLREYQAAIERFGVDVQHHVERFLTLHVGPRYMAGVEQGGGPPVWTAMHTQAFTSLALDTYSDFLQRSQEAGQTMEEFAERIREVSRERLPLGAGGGRTPVQAGRSLADELIARYDITKVTYADGTRVPIDVYTQMASRTKSAVAFNAGTLNECYAAGTQWVEVFDGSDCGWTNHGSPDKANGTIRHVEDAVANPISHPNCQRAFGPRPDVTSKRAAKEARPTTTAEQRADQASIDWTPARQAERNSARQRSRAIREQQRAARRDALRSGS